MQLLRTGLRCLLPSLAVALTASMASADVFNTPFAGESANERRPDGSDADGFLSHTGQESIPSNPDGILAPPCRGDVTGDGAIDVEDVVEVILTWGPCGPGDCAADVDHDDEVDVADLIEVILNWGACPAT